MTGCSYTQSLVAKLVRFLPIPALTIHLGSQSIVCDLLWWADVVIHENQIVIQVKPLPSLHFFPF